MKQNFYKITSSNRFQAVIQFLRKELGWQAGEPLVRLRLSIFLTPNLTLTLPFSTFSTCNSIVICASQIRYHAVPIVHLVLVDVHPLKQFTYINLSFSPAPDDTVANLFKACGTDGHLIVNYRCDFLCSSRNVPY